MPAKSLLIILLSVHLQKISSELLGTSYKTVTYDVLSMTEQ